MKSMAPLLRICFLLKLWDFAILDGKAPSEPSKYVSWVACFEYTMQVFDSTPIQVSESKILIRIGKIDTA